jgi:excisionase family DNA binding protein
MGMERLLNVEEVAERLGVKQSTIRRMILERRIGYVKIGRAVRIPDKVVDQRISEGWRGPVLLEREADQ